MTNTTTTAKHLPYCTCPKPGPVLCSEGPKHYPSASDDRHLAQAISDAIQHGDEALAARLQAVRDGRIQ